MKSKSTTPPAPVSETGSESPSASMPPLWFANVIALILLSILIVGMALEANPDDPAVADHFSGRVTDPTGEPLPGAKIFVVPSDGRVDGHGPVRTATDAEGPVFLHPVFRHGPIRAVTDAEGRFAFDAPDMAYADLDG